MTNYKTIASAFIVLTIVFAATSGYLLAFPSTKVTTKTETLTSTKTATSSEGYTVNIAYQPGVGFYLTNATGFSLYFRAIDAPNSGTTTCTTAVCEKNWPVFYTPLASLHLPPGLNVSSFGTITAYNNTKITTYDGYPLFYWISDTTPGSATGQGVGGFYLCTVPSPAAQTSAATSTTTSSTSTTSTYSYTY